MRILFYSLISFLIPLLSCSAASDVLRFNFYNMPVEIKYDTQICNTQLSPMVSEESFKQFYVDMSNNGYSVILSQLSSNKEKLALNDWLYYRLIRKTTDKVFANKEEKFKTLFCWFILNKSGYDVQLNYTQNDVYLSVFTHDEVFDMPFRSEKDGRYVDISSFFRTYPQKIQVSNRFVSSMSSENDKPFNFYLQKLPNLINPTIEERTFKFIHDNEENELHIKVNKSAVRFRFQYPETSIQQTSKVPLSAEAHNSLIPVLKEKVRSMSNYEAVRYLLSFTRQAFKYETDQTAYGVEDVTFSAEETLFYSKSDCEDRSILFVYLVRELLNLDAILIDFPDHASAAINFKNGVVYGKKMISFKGSSYALCDPTGPRNDLLPGDYPPGLEEEPINIINK